MTQKTKKSTKKAKKPVAKVDVSPLVIIRPCAGGGLEARTTYTMQVRCGSYRSTRTINKQVGSVLSGPGGWRWTIGGLDVYDVDLISGVCLTKREALAKLKAEGSRWYSKWYVTLGR